MIARTAASIAAWACCCAMACAQSPQPPQGWVEQASDVLRLVPANTWLTGLEGASCVGVILPGEKSAGDGAAQRGVVSCRNAGSTWSPPAVISAEMVSVPDAGAASQPVIFGTGVGSITDQLRAGKLPLLPGSDQNVRAYVVDGHPSPAAAQTLRYSISKDDAGNRMLYGGTADFATVLRGAVTAPAAAAEFTMRLAAIDHAAATILYQQRYMAQFSAQQHAMEQSNRSVLQQRSSAAASTPSEKASATPSSGVSLDSVIADEPAGGGSATRRVTGIAYLAPRIAETRGYGLYSYILIDHRPSDGERPRFVALFEALLARPTADSLETAGVPIGRINVTEMLVALSPQRGEFERWPEAKQAGWLIDHYDYGRAAAILACLPNRTGPGPVIVSLLQPVDISRSPHPVLVQDLSRAQEAMMSSYVAEFVRQASRSQFWSEPALEAFSLQLRNLMEVAATGLGMSQEAVQSWLKLVK